MRSGDKEPDSRETPNILNSRVMIILDSTGSCRVGTGEKGSTREGQSVRRPLSHGTRDKGGPGLRLVGVDGLWAIQAVVPQHSAGCGDETEGEGSRLGEGSRSGEGSRLGEGVGWVGRCCCGITVGAGAITIFFLGCQALTPGRWLPLQVRLPAAQGASWGPPALAPWPSSTEQPIRTRGSAVTSALPAPPPALASATVLG